MTDGLRAAAISVATASTLSELVIARPNGAATISLLQKMPNSRRETPDRVEQILHRRAASDHPVELEAVGQIGFDGEQLRPAFDGLLHLVELDWVAAHQHDRAVRG